MHAVDGVSFAIRERETLALVGESGCGKSTVGRLLLRLIDPTEGTVHFEGKNIWKLLPDELKEFRRKARIIFQDPFASLNPRKTVKQALELPQRTQGINDVRLIDQRILELLSLVGLMPPEMFASRYPHELSGGQRQRVVIARALVSNPKFIVADEPVSSLDLSIRAQILKSMRKLQRDLGLSYLFVSHDLSVVRSVSDRVAVMYLGMLFELAGTQELYRNPLHPYTKALLSATPLPNPRKTRTLQRIVLSGEVPSMYKPPSGCRFHTRCPIAEPKCSQDEPPLANMGDEHYVKCHFAG